MADAMRLPVALPPPGSLVHFVGIGGAGMIGLARILLEQGYRVSGSDRSVSPALTTLRSLGATVWVGHDAAHLRDAHLVVMSAAVRGDNPEVATAHERHIPVVKRAVLLGALANTRRCIAVAGTHGKSTTSGMIAFVLSTLGYDPLFVIGAEVRDLGTSARNGAGTIAVVEADEYDYSFLHLTPDVTIITNIEYDHPDIFPDAATYTEAFHRFASQTRTDGTIIVNCDDSGSTPLAQTALNTRQNVQSVGMTADADWRILLDNDANVSLWRGEGKFGPVALTVAGTHNVRNAAMAVAACATVGIDPADALRVVAAYRGVGRRFEVIGEVAGVTVIDDYAHHPTEVRATLAAAHSRFPDRRIVAVFQPHTFSRTALFVQEFAAALADADVAIVTDIYAAREPDAGTVHARDIVRAIPGQRGVYGGDLTVTRDLLGELVRPGDIVLTLGAGDITTVGPALLGALSLHEVIA